MSDDEPRVPTEKEIAARNGLPEELRPIYDEMLADYRFATIKRYGRGYVAYEVIAELVRIGWRHVSESNK